MSKERVSPECDAIAPELNAYVDGELPPGERAAVERHLEECASCRSEIELLRLVTGSLRHMARPEPSETMRQRLLAQVAAELPLRRMEVFCTERHGDQVIQRREVRMYREPVLTTPMMPVGRSVARPVIRLHQRRQSFRGSGYRMIESFQGEI
jgi:anti-sigma factor RsiW